MESSLTDPLFVVVGLLTFLFVLALTFDFPFKAIFNPKAYLREKEEQEFLENFRDTLKEVRNLEYQAKSEHERLTDEQKQVLTEFYGTAENIYEFLWANADTFFADYLYDETLVMKQILEALDKKVPFHSERIQQSLYEVNIGLQKAFSLHCEASTQQLETELQILKELRVERKKYENLLIKNKEV